MTHLKNWQETKEDTTMKLRDINNVEIRKGDTIVALKEQFYHYYQVDEVQGMLFAFGNRSGFDFFPLSQEWINEKEFKIYKKAELRPEDIELLLSEQVKRIAKICIRYGAKRELNHEEVIEETGQIVEIPHVRFVLNGPINFLYCTFYNSVARFSFICEEEGKVSALEIPKECYDAYMEWANKGK
jgi:hypothetical protein